jgi:hypothetical protein
LLTPSSLYSLLSVPLCSHRFFTQNTFLFVADALSLLYSHSLRSRRYWKTLTLVSYRFLQTIYCRRLHVKLRSPPTLGEQRKTYSTHSNASGTTAALSFTTSSAYSAILALTASHP